MDGNVQEILELLRTRLVDRPYLAGAVHQISQVVVAAPSVRDSTMNRVYASLGYGGLQRQLLESFEFMATFGRTAFYGFLRFRSEVGRTGGFQSLVAMLQGKLVIQ